MGIAEIVRNRCVLGQTPVVQDPGNFAVDTRGIGLLDDEGTVETAPDLLETALVRMIPEGACIDCIEFVDEPVAWGDRRENGGAKLDHGSAVVLAVRAA
ncbi:hypothetical protein ACSSV4_004175 [Roseovarius sp. MBR-154]|jgi:hypothetical protein